MMLALLAIIMLAPGVSATLTQLQAISGGNFFGSASWITPDGSIAVVGARGDNSVSVLVRQTDGSYSTDQVIAGPPSSNFGGSATITPDGLVLVIGSYAASSNQGRARVLESHSDGIVHRLGSRGAVWIRYPQR